ncbi:MAG: MBL fold metallo-hydrolase [Neisseriaceae bacterium]|nr:MBL fold metallo-hydrolase [Neisseriaceae bacterium PsAf]MCV2502637.1 MBL fold metallo-hydrolase [Neisseriaceae bacterium]MCV2508932.1 MBL fold metallo-hydrolase [Neisseriaceae bacterium]
MSKNAITILGCGGSAGVPVLCCDCEVCRSQDLKNARMRTSAYLEWEGKKFVIDTGPDFKQQALRANITELDGILYTHPHSDHINGIDDLRAICFRYKKVLPIFGNEFTMQNLTSRFSYCFMKPSEIWNKPTLQANVLREGQNNILGVDVLVFELPHGGWNTVCYRVGNMAWMTDINQVTDEIIETYLQDLDYLFLDCLMYKKVPSHLSVKEAFYFAEKIGAQQTYFIHMTHHIDYETLIKECPPNIAVAYDGLKVLL